MLDTYIMSRVRKKWFSTVVANQLSSWFLVNVKRSPQDCGLTGMAAAQNLMNRANFNNPSANISAPGSLGVISSMKGYAGARQIMLRGRIDF